MTKRLLLLNGLAVLGVVLHHASGYGFRAMFEWTDVYRAVTVPNFDQAGSLSFYAVVLLQQLDAFTLPAFMFVSGFFAVFMAGSSQAQYRVLATRLRNLLIPFAIWTVLYFGILNRRLPSSFDDVLSRYYYIPLLCQYYLLAPVIVALVKKRWRLILALTAAAELIENSLQYANAFNVDAPVVNLLISSTPKWLIPNLLFWFVLGAVAGVHRKPFTEWLGRVRGKLLVAGVILLLLTMVEYVVIAQLTGQRWLGPYFGGVSRSLYALAFILSFLAYDNAAIPLSSELSKLGSKSLGVYLAHSPVMYVAAVLMYRLAPRSLGNQMIYQGALIAVGLAIPLLLMTLVANSPARKSYRYIFG